MKNLVIAALIATVLALLALGAFSGRVRVEFTHEAAPVAESERGLTR
jgi:hypothetical protein